MIELFSEYPPVPRTILNTTLTLITERDLQATTMSLISKISKVSVGNIYHYFKSKDEIINELFIAVTKFSNAYILQDFNPDNILKDNFFNAWKNAIMLSIEHSKVFSFSSQYIYSPYISAETRDRAYTDSYCSVLSALYNDAITNGIFKPINVELNIHMTYGALCNLCRCHLYNDEPLTEEKMKEAISFFWDALCV